MRAGGKQLIVTSDATRFVGPWPSEHNGDVQRGTQRRLRQAHAPGRHSVQPRRPRSHLECNLWPAPASRRNSKTVRRQLWLCEACEPLTLCANNIIHTGAFDKRIADAKRVQQPAFGPLKTGANAIRLPGSRVGPRITELTVTPVPLVGPANPLAIESWAVLVTPQWIISSGMTRLLSYETKMTQPQFFSSIFGK